MKQILSNKPAMAIMLTVMFEFFSYFGMSSLFILYFVQALKFTDMQAYTLYGEYISLLFLTPLIGGWLGDKIIGAKLAVIVGCVLIIAGYCDLYFFEARNFYIGLSLILLGVGFFKTNALSLLSCCYTKESALKETLYVCYYIIANLGGMLGPLVCAYMVSQFNWASGFAVCGLGMFLGLIIFISQFSSLKIGEPKIQYSLGIKLYFLISIFIFLMLLKTMLVYHLSGILLAGAGIVCVLLCVKSCQIQNKQHKKNLLVLLLLTLFGTGFWIFDQQGGSSINLFIERDVIRQWGSFTVPTGWFQAINSAVIIMLGPLVALFWRKMAARNISLPVMLKVNIGLALLCVGFSLFYLGSAKGHHATMMLWPIAGLILIGFAELFIDPIIIAEINRIAPENLRTFLVGVYFLFVGAYANYASVQVAKLSVLSSHTLNASSVGYTEEFLIIVIVSFSMMLGLFGFSRLSFLKTIGRIPRDTP